MMLLKSILIWLLIIPIALLNGTLRELVLNPLIGEKSALPVSGVLLSLMILLIACIFIPKLKITDRKNSFFVGLLWLVLTLLFEFAMGISMGKSMAELMQAYNPLSGNLWLLVVITVFISPFFAVRLRAGK